MPEKILIVDDNMDNVELLRKRLQAVGYETIEGYDGEQAVNLTRERHPDLILLDVMMPKLDGFEVCEVLKKDESTRHIPILMLTAKREVPDKVKGFDLGADDYVTKPFNFQELENIRAANDFIPITQFYFNSGKRRSYRTKFTAMFSTLTYSNYRRCLT